MNPRNHNRAQGQTKISVSMSSDLAETLKRMAEQDRRSRSNLIEVLLYSKIDEQSHHAA